MNANDCDTAHRGSSRRSVVDVLHSLRHLVIATNPFYPVSALLLLVGVRLCVEPTTSIDNARRLAGILLGAMLVMAVAAGLIIRMGRLWDEARVLLLTIVILFLATSMIFDETVLVHRQEGARFLAIALVLALVIAEALRRACRIRLRALFAIPFYLLLACFFVYPAMLTEFYQQSWQRALGWGIAGFAPTCGLAFLTLLPAVWRGPGYVAVSGTPWRWPWFPWTLFVTIGVAVCLRASLIHESFNPVRDDLLVVHTYLAIPFLFSAMVVLFEIGRTVRSSVVLRIAVAVPFAFIFLAFTEATTERKGIQLVQLLTVTVGSPLYLTTRGLILFQVYVFLRNQRTADWALGAALLIASAIGTATSSFATVRYLEPLPLLAFAALQWYLRKHRWPSLRLFLSAAALTAVTWTELRGTPFAFHWVRGLQIVIGAAIVLGSAYCDLSARVLLRSGIAAWCVLASSLVIVPGAQVAGSASWWDKLYLLHATVGSVAFALATCRRFDRVSATASSVVLLFDIGREGYAVLGATFLVRGRLALLGAAWCFLAAVALSVRKARHPAQPRPLCTEATAAEGS